MIYTKKISIFYVCTERELESGELEDCLHQFLGKKPSKRYCFDLFLYFNKISNISRVENLTSQLNSHANIQSANYVNLNLSESDDVFWYPWSKSPKPNQIPELGYTAGANELFYQSIEDMIKNPNKYENFLMLEADTFCIEDLWFDKFLKFVKSEKFEIAGSKYKGNQECHLNGDFKDHINGVALYKNSKKLKEVLKGGRQYIKDNLPESGYMNFDISNFLFQKDSQKKYQLIDTDFIINLSDVRDYKISQKEIKSKYKNAIIIHQKRQKINRIINPNLFKNHGFDEKIPVFFCHFKGGSEHVIKLLDNNIRSEYEKDYIKIKVLSPMGGKIVVQGIKSYKFENYPKEFFEDSEGESYICKIFNLRKLISENSFIPISVIIDTRYSSDFETQTFLNFHILRGVLNKDIFIYSFMANSISFAASAFLNYEKSNFGYVIQDRTVRNNEFHKYIANTDDFNFLVKKIIGISHPSEEQFDHLCCILQYFNIYDISNIGKVIQSIASEFMGIEKVTPIEVKRSENAFDLKYIENTPKVYAKAKNSAKFYDYIYSQFVKDYSVKSDSYAKKIPVLFHVPKNAGTFIIGTMTRYFARILRGDPGCNIQRIHLSDSGLSGIMIFAFMYHDSWKQDKKILPNTNPAPRSRITNLETLSTYVENKKAIILGAAVESNLKCNCVDQFNVLWEMLKSFKINPENFMLLRDPWSRTQSMFEYLNSEASNHEDTNFQKRFQNIEEYLKSNLVEDSWIVRQLSKTPNAKPITEIECINAVDWVRKNKFKCAHVSQVEDLLQLTLEKCYGIKVSNEDFIGEIDNVNKYEKTLLTELPRNVQQNFKERVKYDALFNNAVLNR